MHIIDKFIRSEENNFLIEHGNEVIVIYYQKISKYYCTPVSLVKPRSEFKEGAIDVIGTLPCKISGNNFPNKEQTEMKFEMKMK